MVSRRIEACQYGSREEFAMIEARHCAPIDMSSPPGVRTWLWQAMQWLEVVNSRWLIGNRPSWGIAAAPGAPSASAATLAAVANETQNRAAILYLRIVRIVKNAPSNRGHYQGAGCCVNVAAALFLAAVQPPIA
jgi:hypothetical protein